jgi:hypothetical protein
VTDIYSYPFSFFGKISAAITFSVANTVSCTRTAIASGYSALSEENACQRKHGKQYCPHNC